MIKDKHEFYRALAKKNGITKNEAEAFWHTILEVVDETLTSEDETYVHLPELGKLKVYTRKPRKYKNPYTLEYELSDARRTVSLHVYPAFREKYAGFTGK